MHLNINMDGLWNYCTKDHIMQWWEYTKILAKRYDLFWINLLRKQFNSWAIMNNLITYAVDSIQIAWIHKIHGLFHNKSWELKHQKNWFAEIFFFEFNLEFFNLNRWIIFQTHVMSWLPRLRRYKKNYQFDLAQLWYFCYFLKFPSAEDGWIITMDNLENIIEEHVRLVLFIFMVYFGIS